MSIEDLVIDGGSQPVEPGGVAQGEQAAAGNIDEGSQNQQQPNVDPALEQAILEAEQYRQLSDRLLGMIGEVPGNQNKEVDNEELIAEFEKDPQAFIARVASEAVKNHPDLVQAKETVEEIAAREARQALASEVEDYEKILASNEFKQYVQSNPTVGRLLVEANQSNDAQTVAGILKMYKATIGAAGSESSSGGTRQQRDPANSSRSTGGTSGGKIFSREAIKKLIVENPQEYARLQGEIDRAYAEGRVR